MNYIVFDLEWNQSPNGKEDSVEHLPFEIIEIGAVKLNGNFEETGTFHKLIRPKVYKKMHFKISEVTHMDMAELRQAGEPFDVVMNRFLAWCGEEEFRFCTWGSMDLTELQRNMAYHKLPNPFPGPFFIWISRSFTASSTGTEKTRFPSIWRYSFREWRRRGPFTERWMMPIIPAASFR